MDTFLFKWTFFACLLLALSACSVNGLGIPGSVEQQIIHSPISKIIHTKARGIHINTQGSFELQMGAFEKALIYPVITDDQLTCAQFLMANEAQPADLNVETDNLPEYASEPIKTTLLSQGLNLSFSSYAFGFSLGVLNRQVTRVSSEESFSLFYRNDNQNKAQVCAVIKPKFQPKPQGNNDEN